MLPPSALFTVDSFPLDRVLHYTRLERLAGDNHSSFLGPFVSYEEKNSVLILAPYALVNSVTCGLFGIT